MRHTGKLWVITTAFLVFCTTESRLYAQAPRVATRLDSLDLPFGTTVQSYFILGSKHFAREFSPKNCVYSARVLIDTLGCIVSIDEETTCKGVQKKYKFKTLDRASSMPPRAGGLPTFVYLNMSVVYDFKGSAIYAVPMRQAFAPFSPPQFNNANDSNKLTRLPTDLMYLIQRGKNYKSRESSFIIDFKLWLKVDTEGKIIDSYLDGKHDKKFLLFFREEVLSKLVAEPASFLNNKLECWTPYLIQYRVLGGSRY